MEISFYNATYVFGGLKVCKDKRSQFLQLSDIGQSRRNTSDIFFEIRLLPKVLGLVPAVPLYHPLECCTGLGNGVGCVGIIQVQLSIWVTQNLASDLH